MNKQLEKNNFLYIPNFLNSAEANSLALEFKDYVETNNILENLDPQVPKSQTEYNFITFLELLTEKTPEVSRLLGEKVLPTYVYARVYKKDAILHRHRDRDACEISLTVHLGGDSAWPIYIQKPDGEEVSIELKPGDAMMYLGCIADHWRDPYQGNEYVQTFFHYVRSRGDRAWAYFDNKSPNVNNPAGNNQKLNMKQLSEDHKVKSEKSLSTVVNNDLNIPPEIKVSTATDVSCIPYISKKSNDDLNKLGSSLYDYILLIENVMPNDVCDMILNEYAYEGSKEWVQAEVESGVNIEIRSCRQIGLSWEPVMHARNYNLRKEIDNLVFESVGKAITGYSSKYQVLTDLKDTGYDLLRYETGQHYRQHTDSSAKSFRHLSCSLSLNDDYEGGEFAFFDRLLKFKPPKGSAIMFPSNFMYPHEIMQVTKGTRYSIVTWVI